MSKVLEYLRKAAFGLAKVALVLMVFFALFSAYGFYAEKVASRKAADFCASVSPGDETAGLREQGVSEGANERQTRWFDYKGTDMISITFVGLPPFSRHICNIQAKDGRVISAKLARLD